MKNPDQPSSVPGQTFCIPPDVLRQIIEQASQRCFRSIERQFKDKTHVDNQTTWGRFTQDVEGLIAETAVAWLAGYHDWIPRFDTFHTLPDIGKDIEVRSSPSWRNRLIFRPRNDNPSYRYVFVTVELWTYSPWHKVNPGAAIWGWIWGHETQRPEYRHNFGGKEEAFWVPKEHLHSIDSLVFKTKAPGSPRAPAAHRPANPPAPVEAPPSPPPPSSPASAA